MRMFEALKDVEFASFPNNVLIKKGELVGLVGYIMGDPVIQPNPFIHKPQYDHLKSVNLRYDVNDKGSFEESFKEEI